jgi:hypothetical protein
MRAPLALPRFPGAPKLAPSYVELDGAQKLSSLLRNTHFVEFPTIEVWEQGVFRGTIIDATGKVESVIEEEAVLPARKRRRVNVKAGKKVMKGLLGGYGSDSGAEEEEEEEKNMLAVLGGYAGSDEEGEEEPVKQEDSALSVGQKMALENEEDTDEVDIKEDLEVDYRALLNSIQATPTGNLAEEISDDEADWANSEEEDV